VVKFLRAPSSFLAKLRGDEEKPSQALFARIDTVDRPSLPLPGCYAPKDATRTSPKIPGRRSLCFRRDG
jgi:hypothetical protein